MKIHPILSLRGQIHAHPSKNKAGQENFSSAAYLLVAAVLNPLPDAVTIGDLDLHSVQGDKQIIF